MIKNVIRGHMFAIKLETTSIKGGVGYINDYMSITIFCV